jgi:phage terminase small subunit
MVVKKSTKKTARRKPTIKQEKFVEGVLRHGNGARAARDAGYSPKTAKEIASQNFTKLNIKDRIQARIADAQVHTNEVIGTLASQMRADIADIIPENPIAQQAKAAGVSHLIKKLVVKRYWDKGKDAEVEETTVEMYSSQSAAKHLTDVFGLNKEPAKNPYDAARDAVKDLVTRFSLSEEQAAAIVAEQFNIEQSELIH